MAAMDNEHELVEFGNSPATDFEQINTSPRGQQKDSLEIGSGFRNDHDTQTLARLGKRQVLKVRPPSKSPALS